MLAVHVPATSANLGPGFDCLGVALGLYLEVALALSDHDHFHYHGQGQLADSPDNLIHYGFRQAFAALGKTAPPVTLTVRNPIPLARGLGSSSAALVAGMALADGLLEGALGRDGVFQLSAHEEGHPDNVAPAIFGGFTVSVCEAEHYYCHSMLLPARWQFLFAVPSFELATQEARAVLPEQYSRSAVIHSSSRSALWVAAVQADRPDLLAMASRDVIHEPYREPLIPGLACCRQALWEAGARAVYLSGAGPTLAAITLSDTLFACREAMHSFVGEEGSLLHLSPSEGYRYVRS